MTAGAIADVFDHAWPTTTDIFRYSSPPDSLFKNNVAEFASTHQSPTAGTSTRLACVVFKRSALIIDGGTNGN